MKRGQIALGILPLIAFALAAYSLYIFVTFDNSQELRSEEINTLIIKNDFAIRAVKTQAQEFASFLFSSCLNCSPEQYKEKAKEFDSQKTVRSQAEGDIFAKIRNGNFEVTSEEKKLTIKNITVISKSGYSSIETNFDICLVFNQTSNFISECETSKHL